MATSATMIHGHGLRGCTAGLMSGVRGAPCAASSPEARSGIAWSAGRHPGPGASGRPELRRKALEELVGQLAGGAVDQARADLGQLAAHLGVCRVGQPRHGRALRRQLHLRGALAEARGTALAVEVQRVAARRHDVGQFHAALEARLDRPDRGRHGDVVGVLGRRRDAFASRYAALQHGRIVERIPGGLQGNGQEMGLGQFHGAVTGRGRAARRARMTSMRQFLLERSQTVEVMGGHHGVHVRQDGTHAARPGSKPAKRSSGLSQTMRWAKRASLAISASSRSMCSWSSPSVTSSTVARPDSVRRPSAG